MNFRIFLNAPKKKKSMHYWARIILRQHTLTKITNLARLDVTDSPSRLPRTVYGRRSYFLAAKNRSFQLFPLMKNEEKRTGNYRYLKYRILGCICEWGWSCPMYQWNRSQRLRKGFSTTHWHTFKDWVGRNAWVKTIYSTWVAPRGKIYRFRFYDLCFSFSSWMEWKRVQGFNKRFWRNWKMFSR